MTDIAEGLGTAVEGGLFARAVAGKSTQARRLAVTLRAKGRTVTLTREPGGSPWAERLRAGLPLGPIPEEQRETVLATARRTDSSVGVVTASS